MRRSLAFAALAAMALSGPAFAADFSYKTLEFGLASEWNVIDGSSGISVNGTWALSPRVFGFAGYGRLEDDHDSFSMDRYQLGAGLHVPLGEKLDLVGSLSLQHWRLRDPSGNALNENGYNLKAGLRGMFGRRFEWTAGLNYRDFNRGPEDASWNTGIGDYLSDGKPLGAHVGLWAGFRHRFSRHFAMGLDTSLPDNSHLCMMLAFRWEFDGRL